MKKLVTHCTNQIKEALKLNSRTQLVHSNQTAETMDTLATNTKSFEEVPKAVRKNSSASTACLFSHENEGDYSPNPSPSTSPITTPVARSEVALRAHQLQEFLNRTFPRVSLSHLPTPLEYCPRLSEELTGGDVEIYVKRDDCTGLANGGNKARKLEWLMAEAIEEGADYVMTQGATQSNHARQTAAAAAKLGLKCHILLEDRTGSKDTQYNQNGNVLLDDLFGATREKRPGNEGLNMNAEMEFVAESYRKEKNANVYTIVGGGSSPTGALGYVNAAFEMIQQFEDANLKVDHIVHATGSAGTQAGLVTGLKAAGSDINLLGFGVRAAQEKQEENIYKLAVATTEKIGMTGIVERSDVNADCNYVGEGYGIPAESTIEAIRMFAEFEGILLDPVYSGKGAAGLIDYCRKGNFQKGDKIVFIHTGGQTALHGYVSSFQ